MQKTQYYVDGSGFIQGPAYGGQYHISGEFIYNSSGEVVCKVNGDGSICEKDGRVTGFQIIRNNGVDEIWGTSNQLPWV